MRFRPCIDIHNGAVKQIIGGSLKDSGDEAVTNFSSHYGAEYYAELYKNDGLKGGHVILLNPPASKYYEETKRQAILALHTYQGGLQAGGGITNQNADEFLDAGASHVIVTSFVFQNGNIRWENLEKLRREVGKSHIVLDLSCRKKMDRYYIVTDRWQKFTEVILSEKMMEELAAYCDEFLIHGVDVEGKASGIDEELIKLLASYRGVPVTYAGGIGTFADLDRLNKISKGKLDVTIGSALDLFGGSIPYDKVRQL